MNKHYFFKLSVATILAFLLLQNLQAAKNIKEVKDKPIKVEKIRFFISSPRGGGWDTKMRALGGVIKKLGLIKNVTYENIFYENPKKDKKALQFRGVYELIENANTNQDAMLIYSSGIITKYLQGASKYSFKDMTPIASILEDYKALITRADSPYNSWSKFLKAYKLGLKNPKLMPKIGGFGSPGSTSHIVLVKALLAAKVDITNINYYSFKGGDIIKALEDKKVDLIIPVLYGNLIKKYKEGKIKIIAVSSEKNIYVDGLKNPIPSFKQTYGLDVVFKGWNGLFSPPNLDPKLAKAYAKIIKKALNSKEWKKIAKNNAWKTSYRSGIKFRKFLKNQAENFNDTVKKIGGV